MDSGSSCGDPNEPVEVPGLGDAGEDEEESPPPEPPTVVQPPESVPDGAQDVVTADRAVACRLDPIVRNEAALEKIRAMARWMHGVRRDAYELINHHVFRVLETGGTLPDLHEDSVVYRFLVAVTTAPSETKAYSDLDTEIATTLSQCMPGFVRHIPLTGSLPVMQLERIRYTSHLKTQVHRSFRKRVGRIVQLRLRLDDAAAAALTREERTRRKCMTKIAMISATRPRGSAGLEGEFKAVVDAVISDLRIDKIDLKIKDVAKSIPYVLKAKPTRFLPALWRINLELEAAGETRFGLVPLTTSNVPGFIALDQGVLKRMGLVDKQAQVEINRRIKIRTTAVAPYKAQLRSLRAEISKHESEWKDADHNLKMGRYPDFSLRWIVSDLISQVEFEAAAAATASNGKKRKRDASKPTRARKRQAMPKTAVPTAEQKLIDEAESERRAATLQPFRDEIAAIESDPIYLQLVDDASNEKRDTFEAVFDISKTMRHPEQWSHSFSTDGFSARLMMRRPQKSLPTYTKSTDGSKTSNKPKLTAMPKCGIFPIEEIKGLLTNEVPIESVEARRLSALPPLALNSELKVKLDRAHGVSCPYLIMGVDPGKSELVVITDPDIAFRNHNERLQFPLPSTERERKFCPETQAAVRYTSKQRKFETTPGHYILNKNGHRDPKRVALAVSAKSYRDSTKPTDPERLKAAIASLSLHCKNAATGSGFRAYTDARRTAQPLLDATYADDDFMHRRLRWKAFIDKQKSLQGLVNRLKAIERSTGKQIILAYGSWGMHAGEAGSPVNKGSPPCLGVGLARHLARSFVVSWTPEHFTSKTCFHCGCHECKNHDKIAEQHRPKRDARALKRRDERLAHLETSGGTQAAKDKTESIYQRTISAVPELRSLRFCPTCTRCLNRDRNAANNIGLQFKRLIFDLGTIKSMTKSEKELNDADAEIEGAD